MVDRAPPVVFAEKSAQHVQYCAAARISISVEARVRLRIVLGHNRPSLSAGPRLIITFLVRLDVEVKKIVVAEMMFVPHSLKIRGKTLVKPDVRPTAARHIIAEPLMRQFV